MRLILALLTITACTPCGPTVTLRWQTKDDHGAHQRDSTPDLIEGGNRCRAEC